MICPKCNLASDDNARFCAHCGEPFGEPFGAGAAPPSTPTASPSAGPANAAAGAAPGGASAAGAAAGAATWATAGPLPGIIERIKNILMTPKTEWPVIESETTSVAQLYTGYVIPLAGLQACMSFLRMSVIGVGIPFGGTFRAPVLSGLMTAVVTFGFGLLGLFLVGLIINALAPTFAGVRDQRQALKTAAYACTPTWVASVLTVLGALGSLLQLAAAIYGIYLLYLGLPLLMKSAREKATGYTAAVIICTILMGVVIAIINSLTGGLGGYGRFPGMALSQEQQQQQAAAAVGNVIGGMLGADQQRKDALSAAVNNLAQAGKTMTPPNAGTAPAADASGAGTTAGAPPTPAAATAGVLTALGGAMGGSRHVDPVDFHTLKDLLPSELPGLPRTDAQGNSQQALGVKGSSASADYQGQSGQRAVMKISDLSGVSGLLDLATTMSQNASSESDAGYEKDATVAGRTMHEKYDNRAKHGEISAIVAKRFVVELTGDGMDMGALEQDIGAVDFARLESMKDAGVQPN
jgi:hypothetical protein